MLNKRDQLKRGSTLWVNKRHEHLLAPRTLLNLAKQFNHTFVSMESDPNHGWCIFWKDNHLPPHFHRYYASMSKAIAGEILHFKLLNK